MGQTTECMREAIDRLNHMDWDTDSTRLIGYGTSNPLTYPPSGIGREFESFLGIKFINRTEESDISFLDEIEESETTTHIFFGNRDHETEIGFCKLFSGILCSFFDEATESDFFLSIDEREASNFIQVHSNGIVRNLGKIDIIGLIFTRRTMLEEFLLTEAIDDFDIELHESSIDIIKLIDIIFGIRHSCEELIVGNFSFNLSFFYEELKSFRESIEELSRYTHVDEFLESFSDTSFVLTSFNWYFFKSTNFFRFLFITFSIFIIFIEIIILVEIIQEDKIFVKKNIILNFFEDIVIIIKERNIRFNLIIPIILIMMLFFSCVRSFIFFDWL